jgi:transposase
MPIQLPDGRLLSDEVLEALRLRALRGRELGFAEAVLADILGVTRETVSRWWSAYCRGGTDALPQERPGRPPGSGRALTDGQAHYIQALLDHHSPKDLDIASPLWTRQAVAELIHKELGITVAVRTAGLYLRRWGYTPQRPARKARQQDSEEVRVWLEETYPAVVERAAAEGAEIYWCDEEGVKVDDHRGRGYARPGRTPVKEVSGAHGQVNAIAAIGNVGDAHFLTFRGSLDTAVFLVFLGQLLQGTAKKIVLILDNLKVHDSAAVKAWAAAHADRIELIPLPKYAPERNPVEYLNNDVKEEVNAQGLPEDQEELEGNVNEFLHKLASWPERNKSYYFHPAVQYAAADNV